MNKDYSELLAESDEDLPFWCTAYVELDEDRRLTVCLERQDLDTPADSYVLHAIVDADETLQMATRLGVEPEQLPEVIQEHYGTNSTVWVPSRVEALFGKVLNYILDCGVHYRLKYIAP